MTRFRVVFVACVVGCVASALGLACSGFGESEILPGVEAGSVSSSSSGGSGSSSGGSTSGGSGSSSGGSSSGGADAAADAPAEGGRDAAGDASNDAGGSDAGVDASLDAGAGDGGWRSGRGVWCDPDRSGCPFDGGAGYCCPTASPRVCGNDPDVCAHRTYCDESSDCNGFPCCIQRIAPYGQLVTRTICSPTRNACPSSPNGNFPSLGQLCNPRAATNECLDGRACKLTTTGNHAGYYTCQAP